MRISSLVAGTLSAILLGGTAQALPLGKKSIVLQGGDGAEVQLGSVTFADDGSYSVQLDDSLFGDHFLSMRPFKCMSGPQDMWCHLPYPYAKRNRLSDDDLVDLEYDLLFIHRKSADYGIDAWNGLYYELRAEGDGFVGELREVDLNVLAAPPEEGDFRPIGPVDLNEASPGRHWLPKLEIR
jgi:hypothetical protein